MKVNKRGSIVQNMPTVYEAEYQKNNQVKRPEIEVQNTKVLSDKM
jgi:hypothetical protein